MKAVIHTCQNGSANAIRAFQKKRADIVIRKIQQNTIDELKALQSVVAEAIKASAQVMALFRHYTGTAN